MPKKNIAQEWAERCAKSNGTMIMLPESMQEAAKEFKERSESYKEKAREFDKLTADFDTYAKNFWHQLRQAVEEKGHPEIYSRNIGWNKQAADDGLFVINITAGGQGGPMQM